MEYEVQMVRREDYVMVGLDQMCCLDFAIFSQDGSLSIRYVDVLATSPKALP